ncbi:MAG: FtsW/RodA/SpoVE family cell cycle protein [Planctomycetota bacterium]
MKSNSPWRGLDWAVLAPTIALLLVGQAFIWSTTAQSSTPLAGRQALFILAGTLGGLLLVRLGVRALAGLAWLLYSAGLLLLIAMPALADGGTAGTDSWISLGGGFKLQPSEFMKLALVLALARHLQHRGVTNTWSSYVLPFVATVVPWFFVMRQPDLGSSLVLLPVLLAMITVSGARGRHVALVAAGALLLVPAAYFVPGVLHDYQKQRVEAFMRPIPSLVEDALELRQARQHEEARALEAELSQLKRGTGRQQFYSVVAIGSGGLLGAGLSDGIQNRGNRLPVRHADFIFAVIGEEWGLLGTTTVVLLYAALLGAILAVAWRTREPFGRLVCVGVAAIIGGQALLNLGIAVGLLPVTGLPLPLVSYGGSSVVSTLLGIACVLAIARRSEPVFFEE